MQVQAGQLVPANWVEHHYRAGVGRISRALAERRMECKFGMPVSNTREGLEIIAEQKLIPASA